MLPSIEHPQGADRDYDFAVVDEQGTAENITGWAFAFTLWNDLAETPVQALELTSGGGGIVIDSASGGLGRIRVLATDVEDLSAGRYRGELSCVKSDGKPEILNVIRFILVPKRPAA